MEFRGSNESWRGSNESREGDGAGVGVEAERTVGPIRRLWSRLRPGRGHRTVAAHGAAHGVLEGSLAGGLPGGRPGIVPPSYLAAPQSTGSGAPIRHVAQATGGPFVETRLAREVRRLVASLGTTRGEVALTLERHGVRAAPGGRGPVARYLEAVIGADPSVKSVAVDPDAVVVELRAWWRPAVLVKLPSVVRAFTVAFDAGCYPRLLPAGHPASAEAERAGE